MEGKISSEYSMNIITGDARIDQKIEEWLRLDKVQYFKLDLSF